MAEKDAVDFGGFGGSSASSGGSTTRETKEYKPFNEGVARLIFDALQADGQEYTWALNPEDAPEMHEQHTEKYGLGDDVTHYAVAQFSPFGIDADGIGTPVNVSYEQLEQSVAAGYLSEDELESMDIEPGDTTKWAPEGIKSTPQSDLAMCLNGFFADEIKSRFGDGAKIRVMAAKRSSVDAAHERYTNVRFYVSTSKKASLSRERARMTVGDIKPEEYEEWAEEHGFSVDL